MRSSPESFRCARNLSVASAMVWSLVAWNGAWADETLIDAAGEEAIPAKAAEILVVPNKAAGGTWTSRGPAPALFGQTENLPGNNPVSGAIEAVVAHPTNADTLWIGAVNGGIFRTDNATAASPTWIQQTDTQASLSIGALELDPTDGTHNTLVAGTARTSSFNSTGGARIGLLRTTDGGTTWTPLTGMAIRNVTGVAPRGSVIVAAVDFADIFSIPNIGIFRSTNSGATFTQVAGVMSSGVSAYDLVGDPTNSSRLFTIIRDRTGSFPANSGIYRSDDTGATWTKISNAAQDALINTPITDANLTVGNAGPATPNVFVAFCTGGRLAAGGLFRTGNGAVGAPTWTALDTPGTTELGTFYGVHPGGQCGTHLSLLADSTDANVVFIGGDRQPSNNENGMPGVQFPNSIGANNFSGRLFRVDAGATPGSQATPITHCSAASAACGGAIRTVSSSSPHADSREMTFDANGDLIETDDGGVFKHTDPNGSTGNWVSLNGNMPVTEHHDSKYDSVSNILLTGNQDNGTTQQIALGSAIWETVQSGDGGDVAVAENDPAGGACTGTAPCSTRYVSFQNFAVPRRLVFDSTNAFQGATVAPVVVLGGSPALVPQFLTPIAVNAITPTRVLVGAANGVYESFDRLNTVARIVTGGTNSFFGGRPMAYGATGDVGAYYFVGSQFVISNTIAAGFRVTDPDPGTDSTVGVVMDPANASTAFVIDSNQVFQTTDANVSWSDITGNLLTLTPGTLRSIEYIASTGGDKLVVGANLGTFVATAASGFSTWDRLGTGLPNAPVFDLDYDPADDVLAAGTMGRGSWTLDFASLTCVESLSLPQGQWKQISMACDPGGANTVADVFGDDLSGTYDVDWVVFRRDSAAQTSVKLATTDALSVGEGYWIRTNMAGQSVAIEAGDNVVTDVPLVTATTDPPAGCASSAGRCDMVGHPHKFDVCWADVLVVDGGSTLSLAAADPGGACQAANAAANGCVMSRIAHKQLSGGGYAPFDGQTPGMEGTLVPWDGFWVSAVKSGISLRIPATPGSCGAPARNSRANGWYIRLIAESGELVDDANVLGQLAGSTSGYDAHDLEELAPFGSPYLTVVFPHEDWGDHAGDYASDYRQTGWPAASEIWRFEVRTSQPGVEVTLRWDGPTAQLLGSQLLDEESGERVAVQPDGSYAFTMSETSRGFRWILQGAAPSDVIFADGFESGDISNW